MALLSKSDADYLRAHFEQHLVSPVKILLFTRKDGCQYCEDTKAILTELSELSDKIKLEVYDVDEHPDMVKKYRIWLTPAIAILRSNGEDKDFGIRYFGIPAGYEFSSLVEDIVNVSKGESGLSDESKAKLAGVKEPVEIKIFVTPTCPHCPKAVALAHRFAIENENIRSCMIEAVEFPDLSDKYGVYAVPKIVINDTYEFEGAYPESMFVDEVMKALSMG